MISEIQTLMRPGQVGQAEYTAIYDLIAESEDLEEAFSILDEFVTLAKNMRDSLENSRDYS